MMKSRARLAIILLLPLAAASLLTLIRVQARNKEKVRMALEKDLQEAGRLQEAYADTLRRHPEFATEEERRYLRDYLVLPAGEQARRLDELKKTAGRLEMISAYRSWGRTQDDPPPAELTAYKTYSPQGFKAAGDDYQFPHAVPIQTAPPITADAEADSRLRSLAEKRGYRLRWAADTERLEGLGRHRLQPEALRDWLRLQEAAAAQGVSLSLVSAYRSPQRQQAIFLGLLREEALRGLGREVTAEEIVKGEADALIDTILAGSSIPGYSKHHSGYVIDIGDPATDDFTDFAHSRGYRWMSADNYYNAKRFGFMPSYPEGAGPQGPDPEAWEYIWVGEDFFRRF
jgi:LAS superfamily LD-carboxypeptidase LdcB